jgi:hypothetical protein
MTSEQDEEILAKYVEERDAMLRSLDINKFMEFYKRYDLTTPKGGWAHPEMPLIIMHKSRLQITSMTEEERKISREWLLTRGYLLPLGVE